MSTHGHVIIFKTEKIPSHANFVIYISAYRKWK